MKISYVMIIPTEIVDQYFKCFNFNKFIENELKVYNGLLIKVEQPCKIKSIFIENFDTIKQDIQLKTKCVNIIVYHSF